ncbi:sigma-70 family RNA polymerase sigma factor [Desulfofalx alkaliphila]|uniref:sigma-70 family RNA polymerase sigma factor n=1 Tax=Desulfofalx alkaliphila TaxID=105483 RepID=UPI0004E10FFB|nr:sigma-70 family RNA polymerase sigma factor [Desulfofalx alkaliphila]
MEQGNLESIYKYYLNDVYRYLLQLCKHPQTAEDLTQETFYRAYLYLDSYQGEKVKPWLLRVARNAFIDWYRKEKGQIALEPLVANCPDMGQKGPEERYLLIEEINRWAQALATLPTKQKQAVILCDYYGFSYQEAAELLNITPANLKVSLYRGRNKTKELLKGVKK